METNWSIIKERYEAALQWKRNWVSEYQRLYLYVMPNRNALNLFFNFRDDGRPLTDQIYDSTAMLAAYQRANDLTGLLLPKDRVWGRLSLQDGIVTDDQVAQNRLMLDRVNSKIFSYINQSNLARVVPSANLDLCGGTAGLYVESKSDLEPLSWTAIPAINLIIENTFDDTVGTCWWRKTINGARFLQEFPKYNGKMLDQIKSKPAQAVKLLIGQICLKEDEYMMYVCLEDDHDEPLSVNTKPYKQIIVYRDRVRPGEADGRGIALDLLPTIQDLNNLVKDDRKSLAFKANPPVFYDSDTFFNPYSVTQWAGAMIPKQSGMANPLSPFEMPTMPDVNERINDLRNIIKTGFQIDPLGEITSPVRSATEISIRENRAQRTSATDISRLINECPKEVYETATKILVERKLVGLSSMANSAAQFKKHFKFQYQSPLYDLQKQQDLNNFMQRNQIVQQFYGEGAVMASTNLAAVNNFLTDMLNLPANLFVSGKQLMKGLQAIQQAQQPSATPTTAAQALPQMQAQGNAV